MTDPWRWLATLPSTNARIAVSLVMALGTFIVMMLSVSICAVVAMRSHGATVLTPWTPALEWLGFLTVWAGLDVAQFYAKRSTHIAPTGGDG